MSVLRDTLVVPCAVLGDGIVEVEHCPHGHRLPLVLPDISSFWVTGGTALNFRWHFPFHHLDGVV